IASPVQMEIVEALQTGGPHSVRELAARLARPADGLYHHVRVLVKAGLLAAREERKIGRRAETVYGLVSARVTGRLDPKSPASKKAVIQAAATVLRSATREVASAVQAGDVCTEGIPH